MVNGLSGQRMLIALFLGIALLIVMVLKAQSQNLWDLGFRT